MRVGSLLTSTIVSRICRDQAEVALVDVGQRDIDVPQFGHAKHVGDELASEPDAARADDRDLQSRHWGCSRVFSGEWPARMAPGFFQSIVATAIFAHDPHWAGRVLSALRMAHERGAMCCGG